MSHPVAHAGARRAEMESRYTASREMRIVLLRRNGLFSSATTSFTPLPSRSRTSSTLSVEPAREVEGESAVGRCRDDELSSDAVPLRLRVPEQPLQRRADAERIDG